MNQEQARNLVRQTLTESFDKARFRSFVLELLNEFDESKAFTSNKTVHQRRVQKSRRAFRAPGHLHISGR